jgi:hypothetical protein
MLAQVLLILVTITLIVVLHCSLVKPAKKESFLEVKYAELAMGADIGDSAIPKRMWTYWNEACPPELVMGFIKTWVDRNPNHTVVVLTKQNYTNYIDQMPESHIVDRCLPGLLCAAVLAKYGGIWMDASTLCSRSLSWLHTMQAKTGADIVAYHDGDAESDTPPKFVSGLIACPMDSRFARDWSYHTMDVIAAGGLEYHVKRIMDTGVALSKQVGSDDVAFWLNSTIQMALHSKPDGTYKYKAIASVEEGPAAFRVQFPRQSTDAMRSLASNPSYPITLLSQQEVDELEKNVSLATTVLGAYGVTDLVAVKESGVCQFKLKGKEEIVFDLQ